MRKKFTVRIAALKPRNIIAVLAHRRCTGTHRRKARAANAEQKDLLQRLREAGL
jgi:hypothetical protein